MKPPPKGGFFVGLTSTPLRRRGATTLILISTFCLRYMLPSPSEEGLGGEDYERLWFRSFGGETYSDD